LRGFNKRATRGVAANGRRKHGTFEALIAATLARLRSSGEASEAVVPLPVMAGPEITYETPAELLARTGKHADRLIRDLALQRESLAAADPSHLPAGVCAAEGVVLLDQAIAAATDVLAAARPTHPDPTAP
jgi:hypothetical protein